MLLHDSRREARLDANGNLATLEEQDRGRWNYEQINEALPLVVEAFANGAGPFAIQAAIAAVHCRATSAEETNWKEIVSLYDLLARVQPSPIVSSSSCSSGNGEGPDPPWVFIRSTRSRRKLGCLSPSARSAAIYCALQSLIYPPKLRASV